MTNTETLRALVEKWREDMLIAQEDETVVYSWVVFKQCVVELEQALSAGDGVAEGLTVPSGWRINHSHDGGLVVSGPIGGCVVFAGRGRIADRVLHAIANDLLAAAPAAGMNPPVDQERDMLAQAIRDAAVKAGIARADAAMTGPMLLLLCDDLANAAAPAAPVVFTNDGNEEQRFIEHESLSCQHCGGSGHRDDVAAAPAAEVDETRIERDRLLALINNPETEDFDKGVPLEAAHQVERWGTEHDAGKEPQDWLWLLGYLAGKALRAHLDGDAEKAKHHTISSAAVLRNWHAAITTGASRMRPGIDGAAALGREGGGNG